MTATEAARLLELRWVPRFTELEACVGTGHQLERLEINAETEVTIAIVQLDKAELLQEYLSCLNAGLERPTWSVQSIQPAESVGPSDSGVSLERLRATLWHRELRPSR